MSDVLMTIAWRDCLMWAVKQPDILAAFERTSLIPKPATSPIEMMIDKATGVDVAWAQAFMEWFNVNVWGDEVPEVVG